MYGLTAKIASVVLGREIESRTVQKLGCRPGFERLASGHMRKFAADCHPAVKYPKKSP